MLLSDGSPACSLQMQPPFTHSKTPGGQQIALEYTAPGHCCTQHVLGGSRDIHLNHSCCSPRTQASLQEGGRYSHEEEVERCASHT